MESFSGRVLLIEDHPDTLQIMEAACAAMGFDVEATDNGSVGLQLALNSEYLLVLLDVGLPGVDGFEICRRLREKTHQPLVVFISSKVDERTKVQGLDLGADDYIAKPFSVRELSARIRVLLRRRYHDQQQAAPQTTSVTTENLSGVIRFKDLVLDLEQRKVFVRGEEKHFTALEINLLEYLISQAGRAVSRDELMEQVWGFSSSRFGGTINSHLSRLRSKLEVDTNNPEYIYTVRGFGYRFADKDTLGEIRRS